MSRIEIPSDLIELIYSTATDAAQWPSVCEAISRFVDVGVMMYGHHINANQSLGLLGGGFDQAELERYEVYFADKNPWMHMNVVLPVGVVGVSDAALPQRDLLKTEFYNDWLRHQDDAVGGAALLCERSAESFVMMAAACSTRRYDTQIEVAEQAMTAVAPHIIKAIEISKAFVGGQPGVVGLFDQLEHAIILIRRSGRVSWLNQAAENLLRTSPVITISASGKVWAKDEALQRHLEVVLRSVQQLDLSSCPGPRKVTDRAMKDMIIHTHLVPDQSQLHFPASTWSDPVAGAIVITGDRGLADSSSFAAIARSFGATPAEARLAEALMFGTTVSDFADRNSVSRHTARNQMRALFAKSGTHSQVEFVLRMQKLSSPFLCSDR